MLDTQTAEFVRMLAAAGAPPMHTVTPEVARMMHAALVRRMAAAAPQTPVASVEELAADGPAGPIPLRVYTPAGLESPAPVLVYYHGGGFVIGDLDMSDAACRALAAQAPCVVVSVGYRLAPEHAYPGPRIDAYAALEWVAAHAAELGWDARRIAVGGDSAGGNLAAGAALRARDEHGPHVTFQLLVYPACDPDLTRPSAHAFAQERLLTLETMAWFSRNHLANGADPTDPYLWPAAAASLSGLPPALIVTADEDPIRDSGEAYGRRLQDEGVASHVSRYDGTVHGFFLYPGNFDRAREAVAEGAAALAKAFARPVGAGAGRPV